MQDKMNTIQYMGSKRDLLLFIEESINDYLGTNKISSFYDAFAGSGRVAYHFSSKYKIFSSDKQFFSKIILDAYLNSQNIAEKEIDKYINKLNNLPSSYFEKTDKWYTKHYSSDYNNGSSIGEDGNPKIWLTKNSQKIDSIRTCLDDPKFLKTSSSPNQLKSILLLSLILATNKISNVLGHQNGYLKKWSTNSLGDLQLENPLKEIDYSKIKPSENYIGDIFDILPKIQADLNYFDPPYGTNNEALSVATRYSSFYHLWNTIVKNDRPKLFGKAQKPTETKGWTPELEKNKKNVIIPLFEKLIKQSNSKYVAFSYSNQGLITKKDFHNIFNSTGCLNVKCYEKSHKVNTQSKTAKKDGTYINRTENDDLIEYFFIAEKPMISKKEILNHINDLVNSNMQKPEYYSKEIDNILFLLTNNKKG